MDAKESCFDTNCKDSELIVKKVKVIVMVG